MQSKKSKTTAILLCFFLGIGTLVNFIQLLLKSDADFDARYNQAAVTA